MFKKLLSFSVFAVLFVLLTNVVSASLLTEQTETPVNPVITVDVSDETAEKNIVVESTAQLFCEMFTYDDPEEVMFGDDEILLDMVQDVFGENGLVIEDLDEDFFELLETHIGESEKVEGELYDRIYVECPDLADTIIETTGIEAYVPPIPVEDILVGLDLEGMDDEKKNFILATVEATCMIFTAENIFDPELEIVAKEIYEEYGFDPYDDAAMEALTKKYQDDDVVYDTIMEGLEICGGDLFGAFEDFSEWDDMFDMGIEEMMTDVEVDTIYFRMNDVPETHKNYEAIKYLYDEWIVNGYDDGTFKPENHINRAEFLKILVESAVPYYISELDYYSCFPDVEMQWYAKYVCYAKEEGWVTGYQDGNFRPEQTITKAEAIKMLMEVYSDQIGPIDQSTVEVPFVDTPIDAWYLGYVIKAKQLGILEETGDIFGPEELMTRAAVSENVYRLMMWIEGQYLDKDEDFLAKLNELDKVIVETVYWESDFQLMCEKKNFDLLEEILVELKDDSTVLSDGYYFNDLLELLNIWTPSPMHVAANSGCVDILEGYLDEAEDIDELRYVYNGLSVLHVAAQNGDMETVEVLVERGADVNLPAEIYENYNEMVLTPVYYAIESGNVEMLGYLLVNGGDLDLINTGEYNSFFVTAVYSQSLDMVNWVLDRGYDVNDSGEYGLTPLSAAVTLENGDIVRALVEAGADIDVVDYAGSCALNAAIGSGYIDHALYLIEQGAKVNFTEEEGVSAQPLIQALKFNEFDLLESLIDAGADVNAKTPLGLPALHYLIEYNGYNSEDIYTYAEMLIEAGADINVVAGYDGFTPLHVAVYMGNVNVMELLVASGAEINPLDIYGNTPWDYAYDSEMMDNAPEGAMTGEELNETV